VCVLRWRASLLRSRTAAVDRSIWPTSRFIHSEIVRWSNASFVHLQLSFRCFLWEYFVFSASPELTRNFFSFFSHLLETVKHLVFFLFFRFALPRLTRIVCKKVKRRVFFFLWLFLINIYIWHHKSFHWLWMPTLFTLRFLVSQLRELILGRCSKKCHAFIDCSLDVSVRVWVGRLWRDARLPQTWRWGYSFWNCLLRHVFLFYLFIFLSRDLIMQFRFML
jgi:hypothetical protein